MGLICNIVTSPSNQIYWGDVCVCACVCLLCAIKCWLFLLDSCYVSGRVTAVSSANVISCSVGCESISFQGTITENCRFFFLSLSLSLSFFFPIITFESNHCALPQSKRISCSVPRSCDDCDRSSPTEELCFFFFPKPLCFISASPNLWALRNMPFLPATFLRVSNYRCWPSVISESERSPRWSQMVNTQRGWGGVKPKTLSPITRIKKTWTESLDSWGLVGPTLTAASGVRMGKRRAVFTRSHASTVKEPDQSKAVQLSLMWKLSFKSNHL